MSLRRFLFFLPTSMLKCYCPTFPINLQSRGSIKELRVIIVYHDTRHTSCSDILSPTQDPRQNTVQLMSLGVRNSTISISILLIVRYKYLSTYLNLRVRLLQQA